MKEFPTYRGQLEYVCQNCGTSFPSSQLYYTCPECKGVFLLVDRTFSQLEEKGPGFWRDVFDQRAASKDPNLRGIFRFYELIAPILEPEDIVYLGEGNTPLVRASEALEREVGQPLAFKNDGQNPSASFKDRGMACAFSYLKSLIRKHNWPEILTVCASTGDTSAAAAMYGAYVGAPIKTIVLLPQGKVTPQQLAQPLGSGAMVLELPGVFDDCMQVVEYLADHYRVALLNSKNSWRILGQESYAYEVAQWLDWDLSRCTLFVPIGNAGNISAVLSGCLKLYHLGIINDLPKVIGVQSVHADPVFRYYAQAKEERHYRPVQVRPSVAQAAMIGNPVSFPRVKNLVEEYLSQGGGDAFAVVQVSEQEIIESMIQANRYGHIACTQGGECLAGLKRAKDVGLLRKDELAVLDATAHSLKFQNFQDMYFSQSFPDSYEISPREELINLPQQILSPDIYSALDRQDFVKQAVVEIVGRLQLSPRADL